MTQTVILSPHLDDAALNCWSSLLQVDTYVLNVFAGLPPDGTHRCWDVVCGDGNSRRMVTTRRQENEAAIGRLGSGQLYLDFLDAQYRKSAPSLAAITDEIVERVSLDAQFLAPLATSRIRRHADHVMLREVAMLLHARGARIAFYPDAPYMSLSRQPNLAQLSRMQKRAEQLLGLSLTLEVKHLDSEQLANKNTALRAYKSQYTMTNLFSFGGLSRLGHSAYEVLFVPDNASKRSLIM